MANLVSLDSVERSVLRQVCVDFADDQTDEQFAEVVSTVEQIIEGYAPTFIRSKGE